MIKVKFHMSSGQALYFDNLDSTVERLGAQCAENSTILVRGSNGKDVAVIARHVEAIEEL